MTGLKVRVQWVWLGLFALAMNVEARTWTDPTGRTLEGDLMEQREGEIEVKLASGKVVTIPLSKLSEQDQEYLSTLKPTEEEEAAASEEEEGNWNDPWPETIALEEDPEIIVVEENKETSSFVYESTNYRFTCDVRLSKSVVGTFADMFEATRLYCRTLPLSITGGKKADGKYDILLFETKDSYVEAGGPPSSAGVFLGGKGVVMVPLTSLGVRPVGSGYMRDRDKSDGTLIHEITHQLTPRNYYFAGARGWFSEGIAEYTTATPYRSGRFKVKTNFDDIVEYATAYGKKGTRGRALGEEIRAPSLKEYMLMSYSDFTSSRANFNYGFGLILTTYFLHMDGEGDAARMKGFLKELRKMKWNDPPDAALEKLLGGRTFDELEEDVAKAWRRKGVKIHFAES